MAKDAMISPLARRGSQAAFWSRVPHFNKAMATIACTVR